MSLGDALIVETIKVTESGFDLSGFAQDVSSTLIGALLGFVFALILSWLQARNLAKERATEERLRSISTLKRTIYVCAANVETLVNFKSQYALGLAEDANKLRPSIDARDINAVVSILPTLQVFFMGQPSVGFVELPSDEKFLFSMDDVPPLSGLIHRAQSIAAGLNERISSRNALIAEQARANGRGMNEQEVVYFTLMLLAEAENILEICNQALFFYDLLHDQVHNYGRFRFSDGEFTKFELVEEMKPMMPPKDFLVGYRNQFVDFAPKTEAEK